MRSLLRKPVLCALLLSLPLWVIFHNYIVAITVALLLAFLASMLESLHALSRARQGPRPDSNDRDT